MIDRPSLGILTGISYISGIDYFAGINKAVVDRAPPGKVMSPNPSIIMVSLDCDQYVHLLMTRAYDEVDEYLLGGVDKLVAAGWDTLVIASNTGHICVPAVHDKYPDLNILHIADCCANELLDHGHRKIALLGTQPTMGESTTGLGMYLAKRFVELIDGEIEIANISEHGGLRVKISLPVWSTILIGEIQ